MSPNQYTASRIQWFGGEDVELPEHEVEWLSVLTDPDLLVALDQGDVK